MRCAICQHENEAAALFCEECGAKLSLTCTHCGTELKPAAKFCLKCGAHAVATGSGVPSPSQRVRGDTPQRADQNLQSRSTPDAERRQLTVMFVDLIGSTALSTHLDPEDMRELIRAYQNAVSGEILRFEGSVAQFLGDGVLAYFGWPRAHEDDAERAARAGLAVTVATSRLKAPLGQTLQTRIGIATGVVVVGDLIAEGSGQRYAVVGETPSVRPTTQTPRSIR